MKKILMVMLQFFLVTISYADQLIIEPSAGREPILNAIASTQHSLDLVMYGLTDPQLLEAIIKQKQRGRTVKVILERAPYKSETENNKARAALLANHIEVHDEIPNAKLIHQKTLIIDDKKAYVMTFNFTKSTFKNQRNVGLEMDDPHVVNDITAVFNADWNHLAMPVHGENLIYSPVDSRQAIAAAIKNAKQSIKIYAQSINDYKIIGDLAKAARRGVKVEIITSSKLRQKQQDYLERAGVNIHESKNLYIHAKIIIIDNHDAMLGSINLTKASIENNRELSVITRDKNIINKLNDQFNQDKISAISQLKNNHRYLLNFSTALGRLASAIKKSDAEYHKYNR